MVLSKICTRGPRFLRSAFKLTALSQWRGLRTRQNQSTGVAAETDFELDHAGELESPQAASRSAFPDVILGLSVRRHVAAYALLSFGELSALQFGMIDVRKSLDVQQKALEIQAALRELRQEAPAKLQRIMPDEIPPGKLKWLLSIDDSTVDRAPPRNAQYGASQREIAMLQGLVVSDCRRLFKVAPVLIHPKRARQHMSVGGQGVDARQAIHDLARGEVPDFPEIRQSGGRLSEDSYLMSDAWASARLAQRQQLVAEKRSDMKLVTKLRSHAMMSKEMQRLKAAVDELHPRKAGRELTVVMETRVEKQVDFHINQMLDRALLRRGGRPVKARATE